MKKILFLIAILNAQAFAHTLEVGQKILVKDNLELTVGDRNEIHSVRGQGFDCDLLLISSSEKVSLIKDELLSVTSFKSWKTDWYGSPLIHADIEISSERLKAEKTRMMISCDGSIKVPSVDEINSENLNEKLKDKLFFE